MGKLKEVLSHPDELVPLVRPSLCACLPALLLCQGHGVCIAGACIQLDSGHGCCPPLCTANCAAAPAACRRCHPPACRRRRCHAPLCSPLQLSMALAARRAKQLPKQPGLAFCYDMLNRVSRR